MLWEYSRFVAKMRERIDKASGSLTKKDLDELFHECIEEGILVEFLKKHGTEAVGMLYMEMTEEEARDLAREDGYEDGLEKGRAEIIRSMKASGMAIDEIAKITGLADEEIEKF